MSAPVVDILVLGATGFTGKLITRYLHAHRERESFTFAIAGRSKSKLADLADALQLPASIQIFTVDVTNPDEVDNVVQKAKVVINTVGPYYKWSIPVVSACARRGVHYVDINGETPFVQDLIVEFDFLATKTHTIIVPSCGFDSIPADLTAYLSAQTLAKATNGAVGVAKSHTQYRMSGGVSGGTLATLFSSFEDVPRAKLKAAMQPFAISPIKGVPQPKPAFVYSLPKVPGKKTSYGLHLPLAPHNIATVQRTWGLLQLYKSKVIGQVQTAEDAVKPLPYGDEFTYDESMRASGPVSAAIVSFAVAVGLASLFLFPPIRWLLKQLAPKPGEGPSDEAMERGFLQARNITVSTPSPETKEPIIVETVLSGKGDPGYSLTAVMVAEAGLALLKPEKLTPIAQEGGVLTPMSAFGDVLIKRFKATGRFEIDSEVLEA